MQCVSIDVFSIRRSGMYYGISTGNIILDDLDCNSTESNLLECETGQDSRNNHDCTHFEDAGVICGGTFIINYLTMGYFSSLIL